MSLARFLVKSAVRTAARNAARGQYHTQTPPEQTPGGPDVRGTDSASWLMAWFLIPTGAMFCVLGVVGIAAVEGSAGWHPLVHEAPAIDASGVGQHDGQLITVSGPLTAPAPLGDPGFIAAGPWLRLERTVEQYALVPRLVDGQMQSEYDWTSEVPSEWPQSAEFTPGPVHIDGWTLDLDQAISNSMAPVAHTYEDWVPPADALQGMLAGAEVSNGWLYVAAATTPMPGQLRFRYRAVPLPTEAVTAFGQAQGDQLVIAERDEFEILGLMEGDRSSALASLEDGQAVLSVAMVILGFFALWAGLPLIISPLHTLRGILPFLPRERRFFTIVGLCFPLAGFLALLIWAISMLHALAAMGLGLMIIAMGTLALIARALLLQRTDIAQPAEAGAGGSTASTFSRADGPLRGDAD